MGSFSGGCCSGDRDENISEPLNLDMPSIVARRKVDLNVGERKSDSYYQVLGRSDPNYIEVQPVVTEVVVTKHHEFPAPYVGIKTRLSYQTHEWQVWPSTAEDEAIKNLSVQNLRQSNKIQELELEVKMLRSPTSPLKSPARRLSKKRESRRKSDLQIQIEALKDTLRIAPIPSSVRTVSEIGSGYVGEAGSKSDNITPLDSEQQLFMSNKLFTQSRSIGLEQENERKPAKSTSPGESGKWSISEVMLL